MLAMGRKRRHPAIAEIDPEELASFQAAIRKRYSDEQILAELRASSERLGRSPTMKEFAADRGAKVHPQTVIEHFGTWTAARAKARPPMLTEWQVYRLFESRRGAWATFQFLVRKRLVAEGAKVAPDGTVVD